MKKLLLLCLFATTGYAQLNIGSPNDINQCSDNIKGFSHFNLASNNAFILKDLNPDNFSVTYHQTLSFAQSGKSPIATPEDYNSPTAVLYVRVTENKDPSNYIVEPFSIRVLPKPAIPKIPTQYLSENNTLYGKATVNLTLLNDLAVTETTYGGMEVTYYTSQADAMKGTDAIVNPEFYITPSTILYVRIESVITSCFSVGEFAIIVNSPQNEKPAPEKRITNDTSFTNLTSYPNPVTDILSIKNTVNIDSITIANASGQNIITQSINNYESDINFSNLSSGMYFVTIFTEGKSKTIKITKN